MLQSSFFKCHGTFYHLLHGLILWHTQVCVSHVWWLCSCCKSSLPGEAALLKSLSLSDTSPRNSRPTQPGRTVLASLRSLGTDHRLCPSSSALLMSTVKHHPQKSPPWPICWPGLPKYTCRPSHILLYLFDFFMPFTATTFSHLQSAPRPGSSPLHPRGTNPTSFHNHTEYPGCFWLEFP